MTLLSFEFSNPFSSKNIDPGLSLALMTLFSIGLVMVASSSMDFAGATYDDPWRMLKKQSIFLLMGVTGGFLIACVPLIVWEKSSGLLLCLALAFLVVVLIPGIGKSVNGSRRWLSLGLFAMQASELAKFCILLFFASYLSRRNEQVRTRWPAFFIMIGIVALIVLLLLLEPDFGSAVVITFTLGAMMFVAGVPVLRFLVLASLTGVGFAAMAVLSPYRWERLIAFMDPWSRQFDSGYQLVQSLIAFGRGEWFGLGLGNSLQKLFFLPEAHTDFIFSIIAEEFGFVGAIALISLFVYFIVKIMLLANRAREKGHLFTTFLCWGVAVMFASQAFINMGVASGLLPTKGLTLPFISYGGSSLIICCALTALVFRAHWELRDE